MAMRSGATVLLLFLALELTGQNRTFLNSSFEPPFNPATTGVGYFNAANTPNPAVEEWNTTATDGIIEFYATGHSGLTAADGNQLVELNGNFVSRLYQNVCLVNGETINWEYQHRGRESASVPDEMELSIYDAAGTTKLAALQTASTTNAAWQMYSGSYLVNLPTGSYQFSFEAVSSAGGDLTRGNLLDDITVSMTPSIEFSSAAYAGLERYDANHPALFVNGLIPAGGSTVTVAIAGGTASPGADFNLTATFVIPEGSYTPANPYPIPLSVIDDADPEAGETINLSLISADNGAEVRDADCSGNGQTTTTYTVLDDDIFAGNDTTICEGGFVSLSAATSGVFQEWSPSTSLFSPDNATTIGNPPSTITYKATALIFAEENLVTNGDFSAGNTGFQSSYTLWAQPGFMDMARYQVTTDPSASHVDFAPCGDNTTGTGNMMVVNGATTQNAVIWSQTVDVVPGRTYAFSASLASVISANPAELQFSINGNLLGMPFTASSQTCRWREFSSQWTADAATAVISIVNQNTGADGNDFALDDIRFAEIIEISDEVTVNVQTCTNPGNQGLTFCETSPGSGIAEPVDLTVVEDLINSSDPGSSVDWFSDATGTNAIPDPENHTAANDETVYAEVTNSLGLQYFVEVGITVNPQPVANAGPDKSVCPGGQVQLEGAVTGGSEPYTIDWSYPSTLDNPGSLTPMASPANDTLYVLSVTDGNTCASRDTVHVSPASPPVAGSISPLSETICPGEPAAFTLTGASGTEISWYESPDNVSFTEISTGVSADELSLTVNPVNSTASAITTYYTASVGTACESVFSDTVRLDVSPMPEAPVLQDASICPGNAVQIGFQPSEARGDSIRWEAENGGTWTYFSGQNLLSVSPAAVTRYRTILLYKGSLCPADTSNIMQVDIATPVAGTVSGPAEECPGNPVTLSLSGYDGSIQWQESTNMTAWANTGTDAATLTVTPSATGNHYYRAIVSFQSCTDTTAIHTTEIRYLADPEISIQVTESSLCPGQAFEFSALSTSGNGSTPVIEWYVNGSASGITGTDVQLSGLTDGSTVHAVADFPPDACLAQNQAISNAIPVQVSQGTASGTLSPATASLCFGESAELTLSNSSGAVQFQWSADQANWNDLGPAGQTSHTVNPYSFLPDQTVPAVLYVRAQVTSACDTAYSSASEISGSPVPAGSILMERQCEAGQIRLLAAPGNPYTSFESWRTVDENGNSVLISGDPELILGDPESFLSREYTAIFSQAAGCSIAEKVFAESCRPPEIEIPNAMTPNDDGENDTFWIRNIAYYPENILKVYNRWGNLVYSAEGYNNEWDGTRNGAPLPAATYYYVLDLGNDQEFNGSLTIIR